MVNKSAKKTVKWPLFFILALLLFFFAVIIGYSSKEKVFNASSKAQTDDSVGIIPTKKNLNIDILFYPNSGYPTNPYAEETKEFRIDKIQYKANYYSDSFRLDPYKELSFSDEQVHQKAKKSTGEYRIIKTIPPNPFGASGLSIFPINLYLQPYDRYLEITVWVQGLAAENGFDLNLEPKNGKTLKCSTYERILIDLNNKDNLAVKLFPNDIDFFSERRLIFRWDGEPECRENPPYYPPESSF
jgi:hypothetical protein